MSYISIDDVVVAIRKVGPGAVMAKLDIKHAYRNIPVHQGDRFCLGMQWEGKIFIDTVLPFGPTALHCCGRCFAVVMEKHGVTSVFHYIDDFITIGSPGTEECVKNVKIMNEVCKLSGMPIEMRALQQQSRS